MSDRFEELRRSFGEEAEQPYDHDQLEQSSEDVLSALVEPAEEEEVPEPEDSTVLDEPEPAVEPEPEPEVESAPDPEPLAQHAQPGFSVPGGYATLEGTPVGRGAIGRRRRQSLQRGDHGPPARARAGRARGAGRRAATRSRSCRSREPSSCRWRRWRLAKTRRFACVVALGCVIRGETPHFDFVAGEAASGLQLAALETGVPVAFGVLTCETVEQAEARIERGAEVARGALEMADLFGQLRAQAR